MITTDRETHLLRVIFDTASKEGEIINSVTALKKMLNCNREALIERYLSSQSDSTSNSNDYYLVKLLEKEIDQLRQSIINLQKVITNQKNMIDRMQTKKVLK